MLMDELYKVHPYFEWRNETIVENLYILYTQKSTSLIV
jgi:hypothetical protein